MSKQHHPITIPAQLSTHIHRQAHNAGVTVEQWIRQKLLTRNSPSPLAQLPLRRRLQATTPRTTHNDRHDFYQR